MSAQFNDINDICNNVYSTTFKKLKLDSLSPADLLLVKFIEPVEVGEDNWYNLITIDDEKVTLPGRTKKVFDAVLQKNGNLNVFNETFFIYNKKQGAQHLFKFAKTIEEATKIQEEIQRNQPYPVATSEEAATVIQETVHVTVHSNNIEPVASTSKAFKRSVVNTENIISSDEETVEPLKKVSKIAVENVKKSLFPSGNNETAKKAVEVTSAPVLKKKGPKEEKKKNTLNEIYNNSL